MAHIELMSDEKFEAYISEFSPAKRERLKAERELLKTKQDDEEQSSEGDSENENNLAK